MFRLVNEATPLAAVVRTVVPFKEPPPMSVSVTGMLVIPIFNRSATLTVFVNTDPAVIEGAGACMKLMEFVPVVRMTSDLLVEVRPADDAVRILLPEFVMTRSPKLADPSAAVLFVGVPLAKVPLLRLIVISTPLVRMLLLNGSWICTVKLDSVEPAMFVAAGTLV